MKKTLTVFFLLVTTWAQANPINIYLKLNDTQLTEAITELNHTLQEHNIFSHYDIEPFINKHPLHVTLYLASYASDNLSTVIDKVKAIAKQQKTISIKTTNLFLTQGNYLMLDVNNNKQSSGDNAPLQKLSDQITVSLNELRDFSAKIPHWVNQIPEKKKAFMAYGSPNVFFEFSPHLSLLAKNFTNKDTEAQFRAEISQIIAHYPFQEHIVHATAIGIGYVDAFGQITQEIECIPLARRE